MNGYTCVVCIKQVPDTKKVTGQAMKADGTINRAALPAIFNPEDKNALEAALSVKERYGGKVIAIAMGLPAATAILREALACGADEAVLVTDRKAAGSDTLATSYILSQAVKKFNPDLVFCGRQAIDGDTAIATRDIGTGAETCRAKLPALFTVTEKFGELRPFGIRRVMKYKHAEPTGRDCAAIGCEDDRCGFAGSPTSVNKIESVVLAGGEFKEVAATDEGIGGLVAELIKDHTIG